MLKQFEAKNIYIGEKPVYEWEYIEYKMNADSNGRLYVPRWWMSTAGGYNCPYSWKVSVDGWAETTYTWTSNYWSSITLNWYTAGSSHTIKIVPTTEDYLRARAYSWIETTWRTYLTEIIYDSSYMWYAFSAINTGSYFRYQIYSWCSNITKPAKEYLPDTVTTIGDNFRWSEYTSCTSLTYAPEEVLPNSITNIGTYFRTRQYYYCTALTEIKWWKDRSIGNSYYRSDQFKDCTSNKTVKVIGYIGYASYTSDTLPNSYVTSVSVPSVYLTSFKNTTNQPWYNITNSKFIWY